MKRLFLILAILILLFASPCFSMSPAFLGAAAGGGAAACTTVATDLWQTFEFDSLTTENLAANDNATQTWTITDASSKLSMSTDGEFAMLKCPGGVADTGTRGLAYSTTDNAIAYFCTTVTSSDAASFGFWWQTPTIPTWQNTSTVGTVYSGAIPMAYFYVNKDGATPYIYLYAADQGGTVAIDNATQYWVAVKYARNAASTLKIYAADGATLVGTSTATMGDAPITKICLGMVAPGASNAWTGSMYIDDLIVDTTDATDPLGP